MSSPLDPHEISAVDAADLHRTGAVTLLDVREPDEWHAGHIPGAVHMPLSRLNPAALDIHRPVIALCRSGNRSASATQALRAAGIDARNMSGGLQDWARRGLAVATDSGRPGTVK